MTLSRREMLKVGALGVVGTAGVAGMGGLPFDRSLRAREASDLDASLLPRPFAARFWRPPVLRPTDWEYDDEGRLVRQYFHITAGQTRANIIPGMATTMWGYNGTVPGPTIKVQQGVEAVVRVRNKLPARHPLWGHDFVTSTHLHGSASLPQYDGYADDITPPGFFKDYHYPNWQAARTIWYHDHAVHFTAQNVYSGLAAQYHIHDPVERRLLPQGRFDVPLTITDALFDSRGQLSYDNESQSGLYGDVILVNGRPWPTMKVQRRVYRFRILTASVSRSYRFRLNGGDPMHLVATDGGLMPRTQTVTEWRQGAAERYEVLIDFRQYRPGQRVVLGNLSNDNNRDYDNTDKVMAFEVMDDSFGAGQVDRSDPTWNRIPDRLVHSRVMGLTAGQAVKTRKLEMGRTNGEWTINDTTWTEVANSDFERVLADPGLGDIEVWDIENKSGGWFHPTHIHLVDFRILSRNGRPPERWELGPKDVAYIGENETVRVVAKFGDEKRPEAQGRYMVHCHNLVHEDHDMMGQFSVGWKPGRPDPRHPILAAPCSVDDLPDLRAVAPGRCGRPTVRVRKRRVELRWKKPADDGGGRVTGYRIRGTAPGGRRITRVVGRKERVELTGLEAGRRYTFTVAAINVAGTGEASRRSRPVRAPKADRQGPRVVSRTPDAGATGVARRPRIVVQFAEPVVGVTNSAVVLRLAGGRRILADVSRHPAGPRRIVVRPRRPLRPGTRYRVRLTRRLRDESGNKLTPTGWSFTTR